MSGFDDPPFGEPTVDNPFADPAVQQVTKQSSSVQRGLEDYNPFADQPPQNPAVRPGTLPGSYNGKPDQPAIMQPIQEIAPPSYSRGAQQPQMTPIDFQRRQEELERKAAELDRRETELRNATNSYNVRRNNWPPLPANICGLEPCFYQDINVEIPPDFQGVVRQLYYLWIFHTMLMVANVLGGIALIFYPGEFETFALGVLFTLIFTPFSFLCWYRPGYKAFKNDSSFNFMVFFFVFFFQFVVTVLQALGFRGFGTCGLFMALHVMGTSVGGVLVGLVTFSIAVGFFTAATLDILLLSKIHRIYRSSGASMAKAQAEFSSEFFKNEHVRSAASQAASAAVQSQFQQARSPTSRY